jgi:hypothetical protein
MKLGHPRVYNPFQSPEYIALTAESEALTESMDLAAKRLRHLRDRQIVLFAQIRDTLLTREEQIARLNALDEVGAPQ